MTENSERTPVTINLTDISIMKELVEICATKGIIHPKSFVSIGTLWEKLETILISNTPAKPN